MSLDRVIRARELVKKSLVVQAFRPAVSGGPEGPHYIGSGFFTGSRGCLNQAAVRRYAGALTWTAYVVVPAHVGGLIRGVPLGPLEALALFAIWWLATRGRPIAGAGIVGLLLIVTLLVSISVPGRGGFRARYFANADLRQPFERSTEYPRSNFTRIDDRLDFAPGGLELPLAFFNDVARFNFYKPEEPERGKLPFAVAWDGYWWVGGDARSHTLFLDAPGASAQVVVDASSVASMTPDDGPPSAVVALEPGWHRLDIRFSSPYGAPRRFSVGELIGDRRVPFDATSVVTRQIPGWQMQMTHLFRSIKTGFDACLLAWLALSLARAVRDAYRALRAGGSLTAQRRPVFAMLWIVAVVEACTFASPWVGRLWLLRAGDDPLTYEWYSRVIQLNGLLMNLHDAPLGQGGPYYYQALYPYFLAATHMLFGEGMFGVMLVQRLLVVFVIWMLVEIAVQIGGEDVWPAALGCSTFFAYSKFWPIAANLLNESLFVPLLVAWTAALVGVSRFPTAPRVMRTGVLGGLTALARSTTLLAWVAVFPACWAAWKNAPRRGLLVAALVACSCGVFSLITVRNWIVAHELVPVPGEFAVTLWGGNEPPAGLKLDLSRRGPLYDRARLEPLTRQVIEYAITAPGLFARNLGRKSLFALGFYEPYAAGWGYSLVYIAVWMAAVAGLTFALQARAAPAIAVSLPALIAISQFAAVVVVYPKAERLILPFHTMLIPYASIAVHRAVRAATGLDVRVRPA